MSQQRRLDVRLLGMTEIEQVPSYDDGTRAAPRLHRARYFLRSSARGRCGRCAQAQVREDEQARAHRQVKHKVFGH